MSSPQISLAHVLPITGRPALIQYAGGFCFASLVVDQPGIIEIETRLTGDFPSPDAALAFWTLLETRLRQGERVWPLLESQCQQAPPLSSLSCDSSLD